MLLQLAHSSNQDNNNNKDKIRNYKNVSEILTTATTATLTSCRREDSYYCYYYNDYFENCIAVSTAATISGNESSGKTAASFTSE